MSLNTNEITVVTRKYDGSIRRTWKAAIVSKSETLIIAVGRFDRDVSHQDLGKIKKGTVSFEHFWLDRWYNVFRFHEPDGTLRNYYCNIAMPAVLNGGELAFVDLDIDVVVWPGGRYEVLDRDDFDENSIRYGYTKETVEQVEQSLGELLGVIERGELP